MCSTESRILVQNKQVLVDDRNLDEKTANE